MTAKDEDILSSRTLLKKGLAVDRFLQNIIVDKSIKVEDFFEDHLNRNLRYCVNSGLLPCTPTPNVVLDSEKSPHFSLAENAEEQFEILRNYLRTMHMDNGVTLGWRDLIWSFKRMLLSIDIFFHPEAYNGATEQQKMEAAIFVHGEMARVAKEHGAGLIIVYITSSTRTVFCCVGVGALMHRANRFDFHLNRDCARRCRAS